MVVARLPFEYVLLKHLGQLGIDPRPITQRPDFATLDRQRRLYRLAEFAFAQTDDRLIGLKIGRAAPLHLFGPLALALVSAPSLLDVTQVIVRHSRIFQADPVESMSINITSDGVYLNYLHPVRLEQLPNFVPDLFFSFVARMLSLLTGDDLSRHVLIQLGYEMPDHPRYEEEIGAKVAFNAKQNRILIPGEIARQRLPGSLFLMNADLYRKLADKDLESAVEDGVRERVTQLLVGNSNNLLSLSGAANLLNLSERSLRRKLREAGASFQRLIDENRFDLARAYLRDMPINDVANLLGYKDTSAFRRAFRRWSGVNPGAFVKTPSGLS